MAQFNVPLLGRRYTCPLKYKTLSTPYLAEWYSSASEFTFEIDTISVRDIRSLSESRAFPDLSDLSGLSTEDLSKQRKLCVCMEGGEKSAQVAVQHCEAYHQLVSGQTVT